MVNIGSTGSLGSEWALKDNRRAGLSSLYGQEIAFTEAVAAFGIDVDKELDTIATELQFSSNDLDSEFDLLDFNDRAYSKNACVFQSQDGKAYTNLDLKEGTYSIDSEQQFASSLGIDYEKNSDKPFDYIKLENNEIKVTDLVFAGMGDGNADKLHVDLSRLNNLKWDKVSFNVQETDSNDVGCIKESVPDYILRQIESRLGNLEEGTEEYNKRFLEVAAKIMDQEGYTKGNELSAPEDTKLTQSSKTFNVARDENGRVRIMLNTEDNVNVTGAGKIKGSAMLSLGTTTDGKDESVVQIGNADKNAELNVAVSNKARNIQAFGYNVKADFNSSLASYYNINWAVNKGRVDAADTTATMFIDAEGSDNEFNLDSDTYIIDKNKSKNVYNWKGSTIKNK